jgi:hypothetical protein
MSIKFKKNLKLGINLVRLTGIGCDCKVQDQVKESGDGSSGSTKRQPEKEHAYLICRLLHKTSNSHRTS